MLHDPAVVARLTYLRDMLDKNVKGEPQEIEGTILTKQEMMLILSTEIRLRAGNTGFTSACTTLLKMHQEEDKKKLGELDVNELAAHLVRFAGMEHEEILAELGGLSFILQAVCDALHITPDHLVEGAVELASDG